MMPSHLPRNVLAAVAAVAFCLSALAGDPVAQGKAALALAKAKRERVKAAAVAPACHVDITEALAVAGREGKPLVMWVGMQCQDDPTLRAALSAAVHCHLDSYEGDDRPRVVVHDREGNGHYVLREKIDAATAAKLKAKWAPVPKAGVEGRKRAAPCRFCGSACTCQNCACDEMHGRVVASAPPAPPVIPPAYSTAPVYYPPAAHYRPMPAPGVAAGVPFPGMTTFATGAAGSNGWSSGSYPMAGTPIAARPAGTPGFTNRPLFGAGLQFTGPFGGGFQAGACVGGG
jgi:hypothetical protein